MDRITFDKFFSLGHISVGPTIFSPSHDGNWLGSVQIISTNKNIFLERKITVVGIRDYNNSITEELYSALTYLAVDKVKFDYFINNLFIMEWESAPNPKPNVDVLKKRAYIF